MLSAVVALWLLLVGLQVAFAISHARAGELALREALAEAGAWTYRSDAFAQAMARAQEEFATARAQSTSPLVAPMRLVPLVGRQLGSFAALSRASEQLAGIGATAVTAAHRALAVDGEGPERVATLRRLVQVIHETDDALARLDLGPQDHLLPPLAMARDEVVSRVADGREALGDSASVASAVVDLLVGPRRYLLLAANNAEMRAGSGMFLSAGILETSDGSLTLGPMRPTADLALPGDGVGLEPDLEALWGWLHPGREWRNLGLSPRFDVTGRLAAEMWRAAEGTEVDGVLAIDVEAVRAVLAATGPVEVEGASVEAGGVVEHLLHGQYAGVGIEEDQTTRREQLGELAGAALAAAQSRSYDLGEMAAELGHAARGRHLMAWSADPEEQRAWETAGISGALDGDSLMVAVVNRGGNKLDRFLGVSSELTARPTSMGTEVTVDLRLENASPPGAPSYVTGPHPDSTLAAGDYLAIVSVSVPGPALDLRVDDDLPLVVDGFDGPTRVIATPVLLPAGTSRSIAVRFRLPVWMRSLHVEPSGRLPAATWRMGATEWPEEAKRQVTW